MSKSQKSNPNKLFYGDNLEILKKHIAPESVDLIYLDPPFNSNADYNQLFKSPDGKRAHASVKAFEDTWTWDEKAELEYEELTSGKGGAQIANTIFALRTLLGTNDMTAYIVFMSNRLVEMHRVLKETGTLYLHCDTTASHYIKLVLDAIFGAKNYRNEISWVRCGSKSLATRNFSKNRDVIFQYTKSEKFKFNVQYTPLKDYELAGYNKIDENGRRYRLGDLTNPNKNRPNLTYTFKGVHRIWRWTKERMQAEYDAGNVIQTSPGSVWRQKSYIEDSNGVPISNNWDDILFVQGGSTEFLGYPTQKPVALLERILKASSDEGDVVLDPFCGCGTTIHAALNLKRNWIGIDITHLAINTIEKRIIKAFPACEFTTTGTPKDLESARKLAQADKYQFQWWATSLIDAQPFNGEKKGADGGIDGIKFFKANNQQEKIVVSVKGGAKLNLSEVRDLGRVIDREKAAIGVLISLGKITPEMRKEAASNGFFTDKHTGKKFAKLQLLTIEDILEKNLTVQIPGYSEYEISKPTQPKQHQGILI